MARALILMADSLGIGAAPDVKARGAVSSAAAAAAREKKKSRV